MGTGEAMGYGSLPAAVVALLGELLAVRAAAQGATTGWRSLCGHPGPVSRLGPLLIAAVLLTAVPGFAASTSLVPLINPGFDSGLDGWTVSAQGATVEPFSAEGRTLARITAESDVVTETSLYQDFPVKEGDTVRAEVLAFRHDVHNDSSVYMMLIFCTASGEPIGSTASIGAPVDDEWAQLEAQGIVPLGGARARLMLVLREGGEAWFDEASVTVTPGVPDTFAGTATLDITDDIVCESLIGRGAQDDPWFYGPDNAAYGVNEADVAIREGRIVWMRPGWVRSFTWYVDWCPSADWQTFTFDSPNMESAYRTLALYQRLGTRVNLAGIDWQTGYTNPQLYAYAVGALLEHLIRDKGFTCVQDYTLSAEPNQGMLKWGNTFDDFARLHQLVHDEFVRRGLPVNLVASDDAECLDLFTRCVNSDAIASTAGLYASHVYATAANRLLISDYFQDRMDLLAALSPRTPLVIGEFGFCDWSTTLSTNPMMATYPYAVWTAAFGIEALNHGVSALSIFNLSDVHYPLGGFMRYGLWGYKDQGWAPRPVYHAWAPFTRFARPGAAVRRGVSSQPVHVLGTVAGDTLFWVNQGDQPASVTITGFEADDVRVMTEATLQGDRDSGTVVPITGGTFAAPGQSFGYARPRLFPDVAMGFWAYDDIGAVAAQQIVQGYDDGLYHPDWSVTRDQMAVYIARALAGGEANVPSGPATASFPDVPTSHWAYKYIEYCKDQGIVQGYADGYRPAEEVTRDQMAVYVARAMVTPSGAVALVDYTPPSTPSFGDVPTSHWAYKYIEYCKDQGIVQGYADGYRPEEVVTRDQMAVYVVRAFELTP